MKKISRLFCTLVMSVLIAGPFILKPLPSYSATIDPSFRFSTIETEHFVIHFHQGLDEIAGKAALFSEKMHGKLSPVFQWAPRERTQIVLIDNMDFANGMATVLPYNAIYIFVVPPLPDMVLGEYDNWLELVLLHEYTHILTMDPVRGYSDVMRSIFGKTLPGYDPLSLMLFLATAPPNVFMPDWWLEGIATWAETDLTSSGRGRSSYVEMIFRMAVLEDGLPSVDQLNGDVPDWPAGNVPYIYGMLLEKYISGIKTNEALGELNLSHSGRFPFFISAPPERMTGLNYAELYEDMVGKLKTEQYEKIKLLNTQPVTTYQKLPVTGEKITNPRISPDGRHLAVNRRGPHAHEEIVILDSVTFDEQFTIRRFPSDHSLSWSPDSRRLYFTQAEMKNSYNLYQDIYSYDLDGRSVERITKNIRAKDVDASPDGKKLVFAKTVPGQQNIAIMEIESAKTEVITAFQDAALSAPRWSPDGRLIVFSRHDNSGQTSIELLDPDSRTIDTLLVTDYDNIYPAWSPDGKFIIYSSDRTGVYNLFAYSIADKEIYQVTHVLGGAFQPEVSAGNKKLYFSGYSSKGFYIAEIPYDPLQWSSTLLSPRITPSWQRPVIQQKAGNTLDEKEEALSEALPAEKTYCPMKTLAPKFWLPTLTFDNNGAVFGAFTAGQDVLGYHTYVMQGGVGSGGRGYYDIEYVYDRWYPTLFLRSYSVPVGYSEFFSDNDDPDEDNYYERRRGVTAGLNVPLYSTIESRLNLSAGYSYVKLDHLTRIKNRTVDGLQVYEGRRDNVFVGLGYGDALKYPYSISREEGRNISVIYRKYLKESGNGLEQNECAIDYDEYIGLKRHHVLYLNLKGAWSDGELIAQQAYQIGGPPYDFNVYSIRGFAAGFETGRHVLKGTLEYRFPITYIFRGWSTKPFFWDRVHMAVFADAGNVWGHNKVFRTKDFSAGIGAETRMDMVLGYKLRITPALGIARGVTEDGETQVYLTIYTEL
ncbi:MAG: PD40 domain-containing protein [Nitrospirae bacterium]|nr:PD40 domain-containing protein [Nitrospirota bacterium]